MGIISKTIKPLFYSRKEKRHRLVGPAKLWKMKQEFQINFLNQNGLKPEHTLLDIGCGTLRGGIPIIDYLECGNYTGIDVRKEVIKEAIKELEEERLTNKKPTIISFNDFDELETNKQFDIVFAFSVLIHLSDDILEKSISYVSKTLKNDGKYFANVNIGKREEGNWQGFPIVFRELSFYEQLFKKYGLKAEKMDNLVSLGHSSKMELGDKQVMLKISKS